MKKNFTILIFLTIVFLFRNAGAFYIWQDFDNPDFPPAGWTLNTSNFFNWDWSIMCSGYGYGYGSIKADCNDANGVSFDIITPQFIPAGITDSLVFDHAYATYGSANDQLKIWYSTDGGNLWTQLILLNGGTSGELVTAPATGAAFVPTSSQWATKRYLLPAGTNKLKFTAIGAWGNNLYLDNIKIGSRYNTDAGASGFKNFVKTLVPNSTLSPKVYVRNYGTTTQTIPVTLIITPGSYTQSLTTSSLASGESTILTFPQWTAPASGNVTMKAYSTLSGDQNNSNDTIYNYYIASSNSRNVLIEYCTGTWCQWCPCGKQRILDLEVFYPNTVVLAYHGGSSSDPWINFNGNNILSLLGMTAYPLGTVDRQIDPWSCGYSNFVERPFMRYLNLPVAPVKIEIITKNYNPVSRVLDVSLNATALTDLTGQYKINYVITEDNLIYSQSGNTYCTGGSAYVHKWVVRNMVNNATGENLNTGGTWTNGQIINKTFSTTLGTGWIESNCKLKLFVYKDGSPLNMAEVQQSIETDILLTGINNPPNIPVEFNLSQNYPNPFNPVTNIKFSIPRYCYASLKIYDVTGRLVGTYIDGYIEPGNYNAEINGLSLSSGIYYYTLISEGFKDTKKMVLIR
jgi:hypothetical protein